MIRFLQIILIFILFKYLWGVLKKYFPIITDVNEQTKSSSVNEPNFKIDKSEIEDAEFTEVDDEK